MEFTGSELSEHNKIKIERHIKAERLQLEEEGIDNTKINESLSLRKKELENLATLKDWKCPKNSCLEKTKKMHFSFSEILQNV